MSQGDQAFQDTMQGIAAVERFWKVRLPESFRNLYSLYPQPYIAPCEFFSLQGIATGSGRTYGVLPQFMPFGRAVGEGGVYGFYITPESEPGFWAVAYLDEEEMFLKPVASDFDAFLRHCILVGRYETEDQWDGSAAAADDFEQQREMGRKLQLEPDIIFGKLPRNDTELYELLAQSDPMDAGSLCHLGCVLRSREHDERALDFFHRAIEAAPWFGDSYYLLADTYRVKKNHKRAVECWWAVMHRLIPLCSRTWKWDLGSEHPVADVYEVAADALRQFSEFAPAPIKMDSLWDIVTKEDPYDPGIRQSYADKLARSGDIAGAERELLNSLSLCCMETGKQPDKIYASLIDLYESLGRERDAALARFDSKLPRPGI